MVLRALRNVNNLIPLGCVLTMAAVVLGVKMTSRETARAPIVWYGNAPHPYLEEVRQGVEAFARDTGLPIHCAMGQEWTQDNQNANVEALAGQGYRAFSLYPGDPAGANGLFGLLKNEGRLVVAYGSEPALPTPALFTVATDIEAAAGAATEELIRLMGGRGRILSLLEVVTDVNTRKRDQAIRAVIAKHSGVTLVQTISDTMQLGEATTKIQSALAARAHEIDGIIATGFNPTVAAAAILTEWHKDPHHKRIRFVGIDTEATVLRAIREGAIDATIAQNPFGHGYVSCALLKLLLEGWTPQKEYQFLNGGFLVVRRANLDSFSADIRRMTAALVADLKIRYLKPPE